LAAPFRIQVRIGARTPPSAHKEEVHEVHTFYFDMKDGVPVRDRIGKQFRLNSEAIEHSKTLAAHFRQERHAEPDLVVVVVDESGQEVHREPVYPMVSS